jgi:hypothetical protein
MKQMNESAKMTNTKHSLSVHCLFTFAAEQKTISRELFELQETGVEDEHLRVGWGKKDLFRKEDDRKVPVLPTCSLTMQNLTLQKI